MCSSGKAEAGSVRGVGELTEPVGQRVACAGRLLCHAGWSGGIARPSGTEERRWRDLADRSRTAPGCEGEAVVWDLRRRAQECGREPSPHNEYGLLHGADRHAQSRCHGHRGNDVQQLAAERTGKDDPCGSHRARRHASRAPGGHQGARATIRASGVAGVVIAELPQIVDNTGDLGDLATISSPLEIDHLGIDLGQQERAPTIMIGAL